MLKRIALITLALMLVFSTTAFAANKLVTDALDKAKPVTMTIAHPEPPDPLNFIHSAALAFQDYVQTASGGKITVKLAPGGQLGDSAEMPKQIQMGVIEGSMSMAERSCGALLQGNPGPGHSVSVRVRGPRPVHHRRRPSLWPEAVVRAGKKDRPQGPDRMGQRRFPLLHQQQASHQNPERHGGAEDPDHADSGAHGKWSRPSAPTPRPLPGPNFTTPCR